MASNALDQLNQFTTGTPTAGRTATKIGLDLQSDRRGQEVDIGCNAWLEMGGHQCAGQDGPKKRCCFDVQILTASTIGRMVATMRP